MWVGSLLKFNEEHFLKMIFFCGCESNMKVELLALWCLLYIVHLLGIDSFHVFGDSLVIISWDRNLCSLQVVSPTH